MDPATKNPDNSRYCLPRSYVSRPQPDYYADTSVPNDNEIWQPQVYEYARELARQNQLTHIVDVGCGTGMKLAESSPEFQIVGIDYGSNLDTCREKYPQGTWLEADFEKEDPLPVPESDLSQSVIICSDVIEHLVKPEILLGHLLTLLDDAPFLILSTPDRFLFRGMTHRGPPPNLCHVREWTLAELERFLSTSGFTILDGGWTQSVNTAPTCGTILFVLGGKARRDFKPATAFRHRSLLRRNLDALKSAYLRRTLKKRTAS